MAKLRNMALAAAALAAIWIGNRVGHSYGFSDGWEAGRCYDWKEMNQLPQYNGFDRSKMLDTERESFERSCDRVASWSR
jgi:hypothetical protein